ncbi:MAG: hypothetical protein ACRDD1_20190 [Planctomycetia bacterium]
MPDAPRATEKPGERPGLMVAAGWLAALFFVVYYVASAGGTMGHQGADF